MSQSRNIKVRKKQQDFPPHTHNSAHTVCSSGGKTGFLWGLEVCTFCSPATHLRLPAGEGGIKEEKKTKNAKDFTSLAGQKDGVFLHSCLPCLWPPSSQRHERKEKKRKTRSCMTRFFVVGPPLQSSCICLLFRALNGCSLYFVQHFPQNQWRERLQQA